ncbi:D-alanyl-D-alanine carboxypeptidase [Patescibacteria group bacterium]|nr:MAG: D-alanyl-D-alanine carboxypeptidase [Patescibacteria group bacterium]
MTSVLASIALLLLAPFNALLFLPGTQAVISKPVVVDSQSELQGDVKGAEKNRQDEQADALFRQAPIQPMRKPSASNLVIPTAHSSIVLDVDSGTILQLDNAKEHRQIASLTKMMTAILVIEKVQNLDEVVTVDSDAVYTEGTRVGCPRSGYCITQRLKVGEKISVLNLLKAMLMNSANDAAIALGKHIGGTEEKFAEMMNEKARELDLKDTHFCTASGLEPEGREAECYSTAYDIARIGAYSMKYELIWDIFRLPNNTEVKSVDGTCTHTILNTDIVLKEIPQCLGGKTGFTPLAGRSLLIAASDETKKHKVIAVVLDDESRWESVKRMIAWAFQSYEWR